MRGVRGPIGLAVVAVAFGVTLRWWGLGEKSLWFDEGYTAWVVSLPPRELVAAIRVDTAPPLYYLLLRAWATVAGTGEAALRVPSAVCSTLALGVTAALVLRLFRDPWARAAGVALAACSFMQVAYAHEARFYAAVGLLGATDLYLAVRACESDRRPVGWLAAAAAAWAASLWVNNIMAIYLACLAGAWLIVPGSRQVRGRVIDIAIVGAVAAAAFAPWVPTVLSQRAAMRANYWSHAPEWADLARMTRAVAGALPDGGGTAATLAAGVAALAFTAGGRRWRLAGSLAAFAAGPVVVTFVYSRGATSIFMDRAFIASTLVLPLLAVVPLEVTGGRRGDARLLAGVVVAGLLGASVTAAVANRYRTPDHEEDWRAACRYAAGLRGGLTVFNANEGELLFDYYADGRRFGPSPDRTGTPGDYFDASPPHTLRRVVADADVVPLARLLDSRPADGVVFVAAHGGYADAGGRTMAVLTSERRLVETRSFDNVTVHRFVPRGPD